MTQAPEGSNPDTVVCVQGLGFVGTAMCVAIGKAFYESGENVRVVGVDIDTPAGLERVKSVNDGVFPFATTDAQMQTSISMLVNSGLLSATCDPEIFNQASVAVVDIHLDVDFTVSPANVDFRNFREAIRALASRMPRDSLILIETTVPPGTTELIVCPIVEEELSRRGLPNDAILIAHSYERVMPGREYLASITNFWRAYAGTSEAAAERCAEFLSKVIDTQRFPLTRLPSTTSSELAKIMENTYRAVNIALMDEWGAFAEHLNVDLFQVIDAIRVRPTHSNIREPGLGVGGYCLTKDPFFMEAAASEFFQAFSGDFPMTRLATEINARMPLRTLHAICEMANDDLTGMQVLVVGAAYRPDVGDTRFTPSADLTRLLVARGARVRIWDPLATEWDVPDVPIENELPSAEEFDVVVLAVAHPQVRSVEFGAWLGQSRPVLVDANHVLSDEQRIALLQDPSIQLFSIGRGRQ